MLSCSTGGSQNRTSELNVEETVSSQNAFIYHFRYLTYHVGHLTSYIHKTVPSFRNLSPVSCKTAVRFSKLLTSESIQKYKIMQAGIKKKQNHELVNCKLWKRVIMPNKQDPFTKGRSWELKYREVWHQSRKSCWTKRLFVSLSLTYYFPQAMLNPITIASLKNVFYQSLGKAYRPKVALLEEWSRKCSEVLKWQTV